MRSTRRYGWFPYGDSAAPEFRIGGNASSSGGRGGDAARTAPSSTRWQLAAIFVTPPAASSPSKLLAESAARLVSLQQVGTTQSLAINFTTHYKFQFRIDRSFVPKRSCTEIPDAVRHGGPLLQSAPWPGKSRIDWQHSGQTSAVYIAPRIQIVF
jgi:hypothetical protein